MANVEQFIMQMQMQGLDKVDAATATFQKFEAQLKTEQAALETLKVKFADSGNAVAEFSDRLASAKGRLDDIRTGKVPFDPKAYSTASNEVSTFGEKLEKAKGIQDKFKSAMDAKSAGITALDDASKRINGTGEAAKATQGTIGKMREAMAGADGATGKFSAGLKALPPQAQAVVAAVTAVIAVLTAAAAVVVSWTQAAIASAQGRDALIATFNALGKERGAGAAALEVTNKLSRELPFTTSKLNQWAKTLLQSGVAGKDLEKGIRSTAAAMALMGDEGASSVLDFKKQLAQSQYVAAGFVAQIKMGGPDAVAKLASMGLQAKDLARQLGVSPQQMKGMALSAAQLGKALDGALRVKGSQALENMGLTWEVIKGKFDEGIGSIFSGMGDAVRPFMQAVKDLFGEFNKGTPGVNAAKNGMTSFLTMVFSLGTKAVNALHYGFLVVEVAALQVAIALLPIIRQIRAIAANSTVMDGVVFVLEMIGVAALVVVGVLAVAGASALLLAGFFSAMAGAIISALFYVIGGIVNFFVYVNGLGPAMKAAISGWATAAYNAAGDFVNGIVRAVMFGEGPVADAVKNLATTMLNSFKSFFKIKSPSRLMMEMGGYVAEGTAQGIDAGAADVADSAEDMGAAGARGAAKGLSKSSSAGPGGARGGIHIGAINFTGKREDIPDFMAQLSETLEKLLGQSPVPST